MTWNGYFAFNGNEIINVHRTESYASCLGLTWFRPAFNNEVLGYMLGDGLRYSTPLVDDAPWVDPDVQESLDFYGLYPLDITGIEDSPRSSTAVESLGDGGIPGRLRNGTKTIVFSGALMASTEAAVEYGFKWLKQTLLDGPCGQTTGSISNGFDLCYLSSEPEMEMPDTTTGVNAELDGGYFLSAPGIYDPSYDGGGPVDLSQEVIEGSMVNRLPVEDVSDGGSPALSGIEAQYASIDDSTVILDGGLVTRQPNYTFDGGDPFLTGGIFDGQAYPFDHVITDGNSDRPEECLAPYFRQMRRVLINTGPSIISKQALSDGSHVWTVSFTAVVGNPWELGPEVPIIEGFLDPQVDVPWVGGVVPDGGSIDLNGYIHTEGDCLVPDPAPVFDPLFPAMIPPPSIPSVPLGNYTAPVNWHRRQFTIPKQFVPSWGEVVPKMQVHARDDDLRNLRLRFYADPFQVGDISDDPCSYCGDIVISYIPQDHTLVLDGAERIVYVVSPGGARRRADSLVFKTDGTPFEWPALTCGFGFIVTVDLPQTQVPPVVDLSLFSRVA